eukprot:314548_1
MSKYLAPIKSAISGINLYPPLYKLSDKHGGLYSLYEDVKLPSFFNPELIDHSRNNLRLTPNDIIVCNYWKAGTHFMKKILLEILRNGENTKLNKRFDNIDLGVNIPCIEAVPTALGLETWNEWLQKTDDGYPRIMHTHLSPKQFPASYIHKDTKLIFIGRNPKDVAVSMHFMINFVPDLEYKAENVNDTAQLFVDGNIWCNDYWDYNIQWFEYNKSKHDSNINDSDILFVYFEDLVADPLNNIKKICKYINMDSELNEKDYENIVNKIIFKNVRQEYIDNPGNFTFNEPIGYSPDIFFRKGINGDYKNHFTKEMIQLFDEKTIHKFK